MNNGPYKLRRCTILDDDYDFHRGIEIGLLYYWMRECYEIKGWFLKGNQDQITLMANQMKWRIKKMYAPRNDKKHWFFIHMRKKKRAK